MTAEAHAVGAGAPVTSRREGRDPATEGGAAGAPGALRRHGTSILAIVVLAAAVGTVLLSSAWTAAVARFPAPQPSIEQLEADLAAEQARAEDLQAQLDSIVGATAALAGGIDAVGSRLGDDTSTAQSLRTTLALARARLATLQAALLAAGVPVATAAPRPAGGTTAGGTTAAGGSGATAALAAAIAATPRPTTAPVPVVAPTYPPGVPADWPSSKPIPPMPSPCVQPQLELNGVWNCQH